MQEELGDVLMQVAFHAVIEEERGRFTFEDVCREVCEKLVFRTSLRPRRHKMRV